MACLCERPIFFICRTPAESSEANVSCFYVAIFLQEIVDVFFCNVMGFKKVIDNIIDPPNTGFGIACSGRYSSYLDDSVSFILRTWYVDSEQTILLAG